MIEARSQTLPPPKWNLEYVQDRRDQEYLVTYTLRRNELGARQIQDRHEITGSQAGLLMGSEGRYPIDLSSLQEFADAHQDLAVEVLTDRAISGRREDRGRPILMLVGWRDVTPEEDREFGALKRIFG